MKRKFLIACVLGLLTFGWACDAKSSIITVTEANPYVDTYNLSGALSFDYRIFAQDGDSIYDRFRLIETGKTSGDVINYPIWEVWKNSDTGWMTANLFDALPAVNLNGLLSLTFLVGGNSTSSPELQLRNFSPNPEYVPTPEPTTIALLGIGIAGLAGAEVRRRRKKKAVDNS